MMETAQNAQEQVDTRKWTWAGVLVVSAVQILGLIFLFSRLFLIPPLFKLSIPLYLLAWLIVLILWVAFTPTRKAILQFLLPGLLVTFLAMLAAAPDLHPFVFIPTDRCELLPVSESRVYACDTTGYWTSDEITLFIGPGYLPFMKLAERGFPPGFDLSGVNLAGKHLAGYNFSDVRLTGADFSGANLQRVNLSNADVRNANFSKADLSLMLGFYTDLSSADLNRASLVDARLSRADLSGANLEGADLSAADLTDTNFNEANLLDTNFEAAVLINTNFEDAELDPTGLDPADTIVDVILPDGTILTR